jgi:leucyl aminopeptidase
MCAYSSRDHAYAQALAVGRQFPLFSRKSKKPESYHVDIVLHLPDPGSDADSIVKESDITVQSIRFAQSLVDAPPNELHTDSYVFASLNVAKELGCQVNVISGSKLESEGFGGIRTCRICHIHIYIYIIEIAMKYLLFTNILDSFDF